MLLLLLLLEQREWVKGWCRGRGVCAIVFFLSLPSPAELTRVHRSACGSSFGILVKSNLMNRIFFLPSFATKYSIADTIPVPFLERAAAAAAAAAAIEGPSPARLSTQRSSRKLRVVQLSLCPESSEDSCANHMSPRPDDLWGAVIP
ncbi:hypothetical protein QBC35DRAFT_165855 [Podospora australis]|uniref:Secreted protein n=1 Tax=Podospora australis TaxID=1536484 RepID=A0AAN6X4D5_9PEZI|nr:hypothetical protein QBC35DRAFT_165855 [Podospora australis]